MAVVTDLEAVHRDVIKIMKSLFGDRVQEILLFGSYARSDFHEDSDVDYLVILNDDCVSSFVEVKQTSPLKYDYYSATGIIISPVVVSAKQLAESTMPFFREIRKDRKKIYERRPSSLSA